MGKIDYNDIYNQGIDLDELAEYYAMREKEEQEKKITEREVARRDARETAATAIYNYFNVICPAATGTAVTKEEIMEGLLEVEKKYDKAEPAQKRHYRGYSATKEGDKDWEFKFEGDYTEQEKKDFIEKVRKHLK